LIDVKFIYFLIKNIIFFLVFYWNIKLNPQMIQISNNEHKHETFCVISCIITFFIYKIFPTRPGEIFVLEVKKI